MIPAPRRLVFAAAALALAGCEPGYFYGVAGGVAAPIAPTQSGGYVAVSARREYAPPPSSLGSYFAAQGDLVGFMSHDSRGLVPLLVGSGGGTFGRVRLYLEGGFALPGYLERYDHQVFSIFGLVGGGGLAVVFNEHVELHLGARVLWSSPSAQIDIQTSTRKDEFLYAFGGMTLYIRPEPTPLRPAEEPF